MRLMLLCCTWKDERMGEEEGKGAAGLRVVYSRRAACGGGAGDAETAAHPLVL